MVEAMMERFHVSEKYGFMLEEPLVSAFNANSFLKHLTKNID